MNMSTYIYNVAPAPARASQRLPSSSTIIVASSSTIIVASSSTMKPKRKYHKNLKAPVKTIKRKYHKNVKALSDNERRALQQLETIKRTSTNVLSAGWHFLMKIGLGP